jgi:hypothetical protein
MALARPAAVMTLRADVRRFAHRAVVLAGLAAIAACQEPAPPDPKLGMLTSARDSMATAAEIRASLSGDSAPGPVAYTYRGFFAGMSRGRLDSMLATARLPDDSATCQPSERKPGELRCSWAGTLGADRARLRLDVTYAAPGADSARVAREIIVTRQLPLNVDGVQVAAALADAFERQTTLLDSRDASYGRHQAHIRMGTLNGTRAHYAEVNVTAHEGREELTVRLGRGAQK